MHAQPAHGGQDHAENNGHQHTRDRLAAIGQISAGIAHEIRNPLTTIKGFLQLLQEQYPHRYWQYIFPELDKAVATIESLLEVSRPDLNDEPFEEVFLCQEIEDTLSLFVNKSYQAQIYTDLRNRDLSVVAQRNAIKKALFNLLQNAFEALDGPGSIHIRHYRSGPTVHVEIQDSGRGMSKDQMWLVGIPFYTSKQNSSGLGLTQVFSTLYQYGATVDIQSQPQQGTTIHVTLPLSNPVKEADIPNLQTVHQRGQTFLQFVTENIFAFLQTLQSQCPEVFLMTTDFPEFSERWLKDSENLLLQVLQGQLDVAIALGEFWSQQWATHTWPISSALNWMTEMRKTLWDYLYQYAKSEDLTDEETYSLQRHINTLLDSVIQRFVRVYADVQAESITTYHNLMNELTAPIIHLSSIVSILPLRGKLDPDRIQEIQRQALSSLAGSGNEIAILDLAGVPTLSPNAVSPLLQLVEGIRLLGIRVILSSLGAGVAQILSLHDSFHLRHLETKISLPHALRDLGLVLPGPRPEKL